MWKSIHYRKRSTTTHIQSNPGRTCNPTGIVYWQLAFSRYFFRFTSGFQEIRCSRISWDVLIRQAEMACLTKEPGHVNAFSVDHITKPEKRNVSRAAGRSSIKTTLGVWRDPGGRRRRLPTVSMISVTGRPRGYGGCGGFPWE